MKVKGWATISVAIILILAGVAAQAELLPQSWGLPAPAAGDPLNPLFFLQDDLTLEFGETGNLLAAGTTIHSDGRLLYWEKTSRVAWFTLDGHTTGGTTANGLWTIDFNDGTVIAPDIYPVLKITTQPLGAGTVLWTGTINHFTLTGHVDLANHVDLDGTFPATIYDRPGYVHQTEYISVGAGQFSRTSGDWSYSQLVMDWVGGYEWDYDGDTLAESNYIYGNLQGKLTTVPEPTGVLALMCGVVGLVGLCGRRRM